METIERNIYPTEMLLSNLREMVKRGKRAKFFLASTSEVYGKNPKETWSEDDDLVFGSTTRPRWSYGASKAIDEFLALASWREHHLPIIVARFFNVVGPRQTGAYGMVLPRFVDAALENRPLVVHDDGRQIRCFAHVRDVVSAVVALMANEAAVGRVYNVGSDLPISILDLAKRVIAATGSRSTIEFQAYSAAYDDDFEDVRRRVPDLARLRATIHYKPKYDLDSVIQELVSVRRKGT
jgi:UDP-glucose 4-epimerase